MDDKDKLKEHPVKFYEYWVTLITSIVNRVDFPINKVNRFMMTCTQIFLEEYEKAGKDRKKLLEEKLKDAEKNLVEEKYLPDNDKEKKNEK